MLQACEVGSGTCPNVYFLGGSYVDWFIHPLGDHCDTRQEYLEADAAVRAAIDAFNKQRVLGGVKYCDWKAELLEALWRAPEPTFDLGSLH